MIPHRIGTIASIQVGRPITEGDPRSEDPLQRRWTTAFYKHPVAGRVMLGAAGLAGDGVADRRHHGGADKAVLAYAAAHYPYWRSQLDRPGLPHGAFGENLTVRELDEATVCIGDRWQIGEAVLEVSQPRQPCWKISRRWQIQTLTKQVTQTGYTGWYLRVIQPAAIAAGDSIVLIGRPHGQWPIQRANDILFGRAADRIATMELMELPQLASAWKDSVA